MFFGDTADESFKTGTDVDADPDAAHATFTAGPGTGTITETVRPGVNDASAPGVDDLSSRTPPPSADAQLTDATSSRSPIRGRRKDDPALPLLRLHDLDAARRHDAAAERARCRGPASLTDTDVARRSRKIDDHSSACCRTGKTSAARLDRDPRRRLRPHRRPELHDPEADMHSDPAPRRPRRARLLDVHRDHGDVRDRDVRRRRRSPRPTATCRMSGVAKDRKSTYAAAEAGLHFYLNHLQQDPDYWTLCDKAPTPTRTEKSPVNLQWDGAGDGPAHAGARSPAHGPVHDRAARHQELLDRLRDAPTRSRSST